jgi:hypothetical protein
MKMKGLGKTPRTPEQKAARGAEKKERFKMRIANMMGTEYSPPTQGPMQNTRFTRRSGPN